MLNKKMVKDGDNLSIMNHLFVKHQLQFVFSFILYQQFTLILSEYPCTKILRHLKKLVISRIKLKALVKGWKLRSFLQKAQQLQTIKEIQSSRKKIESKHTKPGITKDQLKKKLKADIQTLIHRIEQHSGTQQKKKQAKHRRQPSNIGRNANQLFKKQNSLTNPSYEMLPMMQMSQDQPPSQKLDLQNDDRNNLIEKPQTVRNQDVQGATLDTGFAKPNFGAKESKTRTKRETNEIFSYKASVQETSSYLSVAQKQHKQVAGKPQKSRIDLLSPMLSPRLKNLVSNRSPLKDDKKSKQSKNKSVDLESVKNRPSSRTSPRKIENKLPTTAAQTNRQTKQNYITKQESSMSKYSTHIKTKSIAKRDRSPIVAQSNQVNKPPQSPKKTEKTERHEKAERGHSTVGNSKIGLASKRKSTSAMFQTAPQDTMVRDDPRQALSLLDLQIRQPESTSMGSSTHNRRSAEPSMPGGKNKPQQTSEPKKDKERAREAQAGSSAVGQLEGLFKEMYASVSQKQRVGLKKNKKQQEKELRQVQEQQEKQRLQLERLIIDLRRDFEMACLEQNAAVQKSFKM